MTKIFLIQLKKKIIEKEFNDKYENDMSQAKIFKPNEDYKKISLLSLDDFNNYEINNKDFIRINTKLRTI